MDVLHFERTRSKLNGQNGSSRASHRTRGEHVLKKIALVARRKPSAEDDFV